MATSSASATNPLPLGEYSVGASAKVPPVPDDTFYEVIDGHIVELPPMGVYESEIAFLIADALNQVVKAQNLGKVVVELLFRLDRVGKLKRRPDLGFVSAKKWPIDKRVPKGEAWDMVPDLAVEVVSESNTANEIALKLVDYFRTGSSQVWVVYPETRQIYVYTSLTSVKILSDSDALEGGDFIPGFRLSLRELFGDEPTLEASRSTQP
jgi:Uma2 family endonuclease